MENFLMNAKLVIGQCSTTIYEAINNNVGYHIYEPFDLGLSNIGDITKFKFNTTEKVRMVRFDSAKLFESKTGPVMQCLGYKNLKAKRFLPTPLQECYDAFNNARYKNRLLNYIKENKV